MSKIKKFFEVSIIKTLIVNFKSLPFRFAMRLPIIVAKSVSINSTKGKIVFTKDPFFGMVKIGFAHPSMFPKKGLFGSFFNLGTIIFDGDATFARGTSICSLSPDAVLTFGSGFSNQGASMIVS